MTLHQDDSEAEPRARPRESPRASASLATPTAPAERPGFLRRVLGGLRAGVSRAGLAGRVRLGRYRLLHRLGEGGMGVVFAAEDETLGRRVAVKMIAQPDAAARQRFRREARAAAGVNHPNVCQIYEIGEDSGQLYIAMELLVGESLSERLARGPLPLGEVVGLGRGLLAALEALHESGVVHRDLKPSNVFLTAHGVKLLDFGLARPVPTQLARPLDPGTALTRSGLIVGTPRYMAPEQILGRTVDFRSDLFSAAAILYEAVSGRPAFQGASVVDVLSATLHEQPPALTGPPAVAALDRLLRRALAKSPAQRPASAREMADELAAVRADDAPGGSPLVRPLTRLVVLPFRLLRQDPDVDFLGFALADAVSTSLAGLPSLVIRSSAAASRFASEAPDLRAIASLAEVDLVLLGTILRVDGQLRVSTQLLEAPAGTIVSSHTLHAPLGDVFRLQDELASRIVESLSPSLAGAPAKRGPASARAYEFYLRANEVLRDWSQAAVARDLYRQCVREDPSFAPAWARLGRTHRLLAKYHRERPEQNLALADEALRRALELDPELPVAHELFAHHEAERGHAREAMVRLLGLALQVSNDPELWAGLVHACRYCGLLDASLAAHREARRLDPHVWTSVVYTWWALGDFEAILGEATEGADAELRPLALHALGRTAEALRELRELGSRPAPPVVLGMARDLVPLLAREAGAPDALARIVSAHTDPEALALYGSCQAAAGDHERALGTLEQAVDSGYHVPQLLRAQPWLAPLRDLPRARALAARAEAGREEALGAFRDAGGPALLGLASA